MYQCFASVSVHRCIRNECLGYLPRDTQAITRQQSVHIWCLISAFVSASVPCCCICDVVVLGICVCVYSLKISFLFILRQMLQKGTRHSWCMLLDTLYQFPYQCLCCHPFQSLCNCTWDICTYTDLLWISFSSFHFYILDISSHFFLPLFSANATKRYSISSHLIDSSASSIFEYFLQYHNTSFMLHMDMKCHLLVLMFDITSVMCVRI